MFRRFFVIVLPLLGAAACSGDSGAGADPHTQEMWDRVTEQARALAQAPYRAPEIRVSREMATATTRNPAHNKPT